LLVQQFEASIYFQGGDGGSNSGRASKSEGEPVKQSLCQKKKLTGGSQLWYQIMYAGDEWFFCLYPTSITPGLSQNCAQE